MLEFSDHILVITIFIIIFIIVNFLYFFLKYTGGYM